MSTLSTSDSETDPYADSGSSYKPDDSQDEKSSGTSGDESPIESIAATGDMDVQRQSTPSQTQSPRNMKRGARRKYKDESQWKRNIRKKMRNSGKQYENVKGKVVPEKVFDRADCDCMRECHKLISLQQREKIFKSFYSLANFDLQTSYLCGQIKLCEKARSNDSRRGCTRLYYIPAENGTEIPVCKEFFKKIFKVSDGRLSRALRGKQTGDVPPTDKRGKKVPYNKTAINRVEAVKAFINKLPKYQSHYSRKKNPNKQFLAPTLNLTILYNLYKNETENFVSQRVFTNIFKKDFNLSFHAPISDSCKTCDSLEQRIKHDSDENTRKSLQIEREVHQKKAEAARVSMKTDADFAKDHTNNVTVIAFDLMSTLPTPHLSTGVCYYKRQLWTYCFGINNLSSGDSYMYVWDESKASRGPAEIGTCLMHFIKNYVTTSHLIMYSDQCGGQNRNIKIALLCNFIVQSQETTVNLIDHKFLVSGHTYLACDRDFGIIEKSKKSFSDIFVPDDWIKVIKNARKRNPFNVIELNNTNFISTETLQKNIVNRKETENNYPVSWLKIQWLRYEAAHPYKISFKETVNADFNFDTINIKKRTGTVEINALPMLYPKGREIDILKYKNLLELLPYIPPVLHKFYTDLKVKQNSAPNTNSNADDDPMGLYDPAEFSQNENQEMTQDERSLEENNPKPKRNTHSAKKQKTCGKK